MTYRALFLAAVLSIPAGVDAQSKNVFFYGAIVQASSHPDLTDQVVGMSTRSREDARRAACAHFDPNIGNAAVSSPAHLEACLAGADRTWNNPHDGSTIVVTVLPLECRQTRAFALAWGSSGQGAPPASGRPMKHYMTCGKKSVAEARDLVMGACRKEYSDCRLYVAAYGDGTFGGRHGVSVPNRAHCWGRDAILDERWGPETIESVQRECRRLAEAAAQRDGGKQ